MKNWIELKIFLDMSKIRKLERSELFESYRFESFTMKPIHIKRQFVLDRKELLAQIKWTIPVSTVLFLTSLWFVPYSLPFILFSLGSGILLSVGLCLTWITGFIIIYWIVFYVIILGIIHGDEYLLGYNLTNWAMLQYIGLAMVAFYTFLFLCRFYIK